MSKPIKLEMIYNEYSEFIWDAVTNLSLDGPHHLMQLLGVGDQFVAWGSRPHDEDRSMSDELRCLFKGLSGPHGKTILKIYRIKHGLEK